MSEEQQQVIEAGPDAQTEFGQAHRAWELAQARAAAATAQQQAADAQRMNVVLREMAAQGLKPSEWNPTVNESGVLTFVKIEQKAQAAGR